MIYLKNTKIYEPLVRYKCMAEDKNVVLRQITEVSSEFGYEKCAKTPRFQKKLLRQFSW